VTGAFRGKGHGGSKKGTTKAETKTDARRHDGNPSRRQDQWLRIEHAEGGCMDAILQTLFDLQERPRFVYEHVWRPGDILMWDNRCTFLARSRCSARHTNGAKAMQIVCARATCRNSEAGER
jgi:hypothetical protein